VAGPGQTWRAEWGPDGAHLYWKLTITDAAQTVALEERTGACFPGPRPLDLYLTALGFKRTGAWVPGNRGTYAAPVTAEPKLEARLLKAVEQDSSDVAGAPPGKAAPGGAPS
jgi:hypothetical protein